MAEGAERFRGLWEDEMFARQDRIPQKPSTVTSRLPTAEEAEVHPQP